MTGFEIGLDPGHGGTDSGAVGSKGLLEKAVNLDVALQLRKLLEANNINVLMTRENDTGLELAWRASLLNKGNCDLVVSIHCNSAEVVANYVATFIVGEGGKAQIAATLIQRRLVETTGWPDGGVRVANFAILRDTIAPAVLVEMGFISNPEQEEWLSNTANRGKLASAIAKGICDFLGIPFNPPATKDYEGHLHAEAIKKAIKLGLMVGYPDGNFAPDNPCTRAEVAKVAVTTYEAVIDEIINRLNNTSI